MKRVAAVTAVSLVMLAPLLWTVDAWARAGRGGSSGSRGSRSYSSPAPSSPARAPAGSVSPSPRPAQPPPAAAPGSSGLAGMAGGLIAGGLLGSLLSGGGGGFGFMGLAVLAFLAYVAFRKMRGAQPEPAGAASTSNMVLATPTPSRGDRDAPAPWGATAGAAAQARPPDATDEAEMARLAADIFLRVQAAWTAGDMEQASDVLTPEMRAQLQKDGDAQRAQGRINRIENVQVRTVEVAETWQEPGRNFATVRIEASLLDYVVDSKTGAILDGVATEPVTFVEYWTLTRAVWVKAWRLTAIQQPAVTQA